MKKIGLSLLATVSALLLLVAAIAARHLVYWSPSENVTFASGGIRLAGTLVRPSQEGVFPAIVLLHGSGPETRAEPPTRAVINTLVRSGFAVLAYDKRGVGESGGVFDGARYTDFIDDAIAAVSYLGERPDVDDSVMGLYTVSESGWFGPEIAVRDGRIKFIFSKVGCPLSVMETVLWEVRNDFIADGIPEPDVQPLVDVTRRRWNYYMATAQNPGLAMSGEREALNRRLRTLRRDVPMAAQVLPEEILPYDADYYDAFSADYSYDPKPFLEKLDIPLYYVYGGTDVNVPTEQCVAVLQSLVRELGKDIQFTVYPDVGHSLGTWRGLLSVGLVPGYLEELSAWAADRSGR